MVLFLEHMRSENEIVGKAMDILNPVVVNAFGPNINRRTINNIIKAGFEVIEEKDLFASIFRIVVAKPVYIT